jgi:hypothetical protein
MPNYATHLNAGTVAGGAAALVLANTQPAPSLIAEVAGGLVGGALGGIMPDIIEPATSPNHRKLAHSAVAAGSLTLAKITQWQASCRQRAAVHTSLAQRLVPNSPERSNAEFQAMLWSFLAGLTVGFVAGYASHLALDATTKRSLPLIGL